MLMNFDWFDRAEYPQIILTKPDGTEIDEIGVYSELNVDMKYNDISEISFRVDFDTKKQDTYDLIKGKKYLEINLYGKFIIDDVVSVDDGVSKYKEILCKSVDFELSYKRFTLEPKTYKLYDVFEPEETLMYRIISLIPSWSIGSMDASIGSLYRYFDVEDIDLLSFMLGDMEDAYQCIFEFDYFNREINIKALENVGEDTNIYISFDNLMDKIELSELSNEVVTYLKVYGGNDLNIRSVNPTGSNGILNLAYFKDLEWMSEDLITALDNYSILYSSKSTTYSSYLLSYKNLNEATDILEGELGVLENEYDALETVLKERIQADLITTSIISSMTEKVLEIDSKNNEISNKVSEMNVYIDLLTSIVDELDLATNFTSQQIIDLDKYIIEYTYQNDAYTITDTMTETEKLEQAELLLSDAMTILERLSQPRLSFNIDVVDFLTMIKYDDFISKFELASKMYIEFDEDTIVESRLIGYTYDWDNHDLKLEFTSKYRTNDSTYTYEELYNKSISAGISVSFEKLQYKDWSSNSKDVVTSFITSSLDASLNNLISSEKQEVVINENGIKCREVDDNGDYLDEQIWVVNNMLAFTDNAWADAKIAIGKINDSRYGEVWGIVAPYLVGNIIAGNNLRISNTANQFTLDESGATLTNASFTMTMDNNKGKIILDPTNGIKIQNNSTGTFTDGIYLGSDGRIKAQYIDISEDATFGGELSAAKGTFEGELIAAKGTFEGELIAAKGTFAGELIAATITGSTIYGGRYYNKQGDSYMDMDYVGNVVFSNSSDTNGLYVELNQSGVGLYSKYNNDISQILYSYQGYTWADNLWYFVNKPVIHDSLYGDSYAASRSWVEYQVSEDYLKKYSGRTYGISQEASSPYSDLSISATTTGITIRSGSTVLGSIAYI